MRRRTVPPRGICATTLRPSHKPTPQHAAHTHARAASYRAKLEPERVAAGAARIELALLLPRRRRFINGARVVHLKVVVDLRLRRVRVVTAVRLGDHVDRDVGRRGNEAERNAELGEHRKNWGGVCGRGALKCMVQNRR